MTTLTTPAQVGSTAEIDPSIYSFRQAGSAILVDIPEELEQRFQNAAKRHYGILDGKHSILTSEAIALGERFLREDDHAVALTKLGYRILTDLDQNTTALYPPTTLKELIENYYKVQYAHIAAGTINESQIQHIGIIYKEAETDLVKCWVPAQIEKAPIELQSVNSEAPREIPQLDWHNELIKNVLPISIEYLAHETGHLSLAVHHPNAVRAGIEGYRQHGVINDQSVSYGAFDNRILYVGEYAAVPAINPSTDEIVMVLETLLEPRLMQRAEVLDFLTNQFCEMEDSQLEANAMIVLGAKHELFIGIGGFSRDPVPLGKALAEMYMSGVDAPEQFGPRAIQIALAGAFDIYFRRDHVEKKLTSFSPSESSSEYMDRTDVMHPLYSCLSVCNASHAMNGDSNWLRKTIARNLASISTAIFFGRKLEMDPEKFISNMFTLDGFSYESLGTTDGSIYTELDCRDALVYLRSFDHNWKEELKYQPQRVYLGYSEYRPPYLEQAYTPLRSMKWFE